MTRVLVARATRVDRADGGKVGGWQIHLRMYHDSCFDFSADARSFPSLSTIATVECPVSHVHVSRRMQRAPWRRRSRTQKAGNPGFGVCGRPHVKTEEF